MSKKIDEKIQKVKKEHEELLSLALEQISEQSEDIQTYSSDIISALDYDEKSLKKYQATVEAQNMIAALTEQILKATTPEEIATLRKKINYNISKIRAELKRRNVSEETIENYNNQVTTLRKSMATYLRFIKRSENISQIYSLSSNIDELSKEELSTLKKCLQKEERYNKRNLNSYNKIKEAPVEEKIPDGAVEEIEQIPETINDLEFTISEEATGFPAPLTDSLIVEISEPLDKQNIKDYSVRLISKNTTYEETCEYFENNLTHFSQMYDIVETLDYTQNNIGGNLINFFRNIPRYVHNKKAIIEMQRQCVLYYNGNDFVSFIECMKERNSIQQAIHYIFADSTLKASEINSLSSHENCSRWMHDFCAKRNLPIYIRNR